MCQDRYFARAVSFIIIILVIGGLLSSCQKKEYIIHENIIEELEKIQDSLDSSVTFQENNLKQPGGASLSYYTKLPQELELYVELPAKPKETSATISIHTDNAEPQTFQIEKKGSHSFDLSKFSGKIIGIQLDVESEKNSLQWDAVVLRSLKDPKADKQPVQETPAELPDLTDYDVVYLLLDAFDAKHASLYGYDRKTTPFLDEFAKESVVFDNMFVNAPYTLASTGVLFTSKFAHENGLISEKNRLSPIIPTISELLAGVDIPSYLISIHGYLIGDWGLSRGFSEVLKGKYGHGPNGRPVNAFDNLEKLYEDDAQGRKFIYIHLGPPHSPYVPPEQFRKFVPEISSEEIEPVNEFLHKIDKGELQINDEQLEYIIGWYDSNVLYADYLAQKMIERLTELDQLERSIVIITSDHGEGFMQHKRMLHGSTVFDEMLHVPFIVRFPKELNVSPRRIPYIASLVDVTPTLSEIFGIEPADFSGKSLLPAIFHDQAINPFIYSEALVYEDLRTVRDLEYKYISSPKRDMLFELKNDPQEQQNLAKKRPVTAGYYRQLLQQLMQQHPEVSSDKEIDMDTQDPEVLKNLKDLGYIK